MNRSKRGRPSAPAEQHAEGRLAAGCCACRWSYPFGSRTPRQNDVHRHPGRSAERHIRSDPPAGLPVTSTVTFGHRQLNPRAVVRSECEAAWHRLCGGPDQGDLGSLAGRAHHPAEPAVLTPASGSPVSKGVASCVQHPWTRSRSLRGLPRMAGGHRAFYRAGYTGHLHLRTRPDLRRSRRGLGYWVTDVSAGSARTSHSCTSRQFCSRTIVSSGHCS